jgi:hypothetical protein
MAMRTLAFFWLLAIVHDHAYARRKRREQNLLDMGLEPQAGR